MTSCDLCVPRDTAYHANKMWKVRWIQSSEMAVLIFSASSVQESDSVAVFLIIHTKSDVYVNKTSDINLELQFCSYLVIFKGWVTFDAASKVISILKSISIVHYLGGTMAWKKHFLD